MPFSVALTGLYFSGFCTRGCAVLQTAYPELCSYAPFRVYAPTGLACLQEYLSLAIGLGSYDPYRVPAL